VNRESHRQYVERAALREAQRVFAGREQRANLGDFLALRIQTVPPWKRMCCVAIGVGVGAIAGWLAVERAASPWAIGFLAVLSLVALVVGIIGWKRPVEAVLEGTADALFNRLIDAL
jgi:hypothetical protein